MSANPGMSRAERFEDEKRRIIESCFNKRDDDGSGLPPRHALSLQSAPTPVVTC